MTLGTVIAMSNPTIDEVIAKAASYIGVSGTDNEFNTWYWGYHCYDPNVYPWCAVFQSYVFLNSGFDCAASASAAGFANQFERIPLEYENDVQPGDIVVFNWDGRQDTGWCDHVGLVEWANIGLDGCFGTIEGNTGWADGGEVARVTRTNWGSYFTAFFRPYYGSGYVPEPEPQPAPEPAPAPAPKKAKKLFGIDVSSNQSADVVALAKNNFAIVKLSGNPQSYAWDFVNPYVDQQVADALNKHGLVGAYHFTWGLDAVTEAKFFVEQFKAHGLVGKAWPVIDYEAEALNLGREWLAKFARYVEKHLKVKPLIYSSGSVIVAQDLFSLGYPIWCANYYRGYDEVDGRSTSGLQIYPGCEESMMWQFTSQGRVEGYGDLLDCNVFFGSKALFKKFIAGKAKKWSPSKDEGGDGGKSIDELANEVIAGVWGNGDARRAALEAAGYDYNAVQQRVNELLGGGGVDIDALARDVIAGRYGNGEDRRNALGPNYDAVQQRVNEMLGYGSGSGIDVDALAWEVIAGKYGNGEERRAALGSNYDVVQQRVNELLG